MNQVNDKWRYVKLGDLCKVIMGQSPASSTYNTDEKGLPFFQGKAEFTDLYPVTRKWCSEPGKIAGVNDILLSVRAPVGATNIANKECCIGRGLAAIRYSNHKYIFYFLRSIEQELDKKGTGTTFRSISGEVLRNTIVPVTSIEEQNSIVEKIEELFSEIDKGIESLKIAQQQLRVYRQSVLKSAFEGKLTNQYIENDRLPKTWKFITLKEVCNKIQDGSHFSPQIQYDECGSDRYMYITAKNIRNNYMDFKKIIYVDKDFHESIYQRCNPEYGDVLLTKDGINTGECTLNTLNEPFCLLSSVCLFKTKKDILLPEYLKYFIQSPFGNKAILESMTGTAIKRIVLGKIKSAIVRLPLIEEQNQIVQEIESRLSVCDKMEETISTSLQQAESLRQSILKRAFEGKLVKMDNSKQPAKVISINAKRDVWQRKVLAGKIVFSCHKERSFGTTKFQKLLYLCEQHAQLDFDTHYVKQTAGPLDATFIYPFIKEAIAQEWLVQENDNTLHRFEPLLGLGKLTGDYPKYFKEPGNKINFVINLLKDKNTDESELIATIYAIWNNYLISGLKLQATELVKEVYEWSESKAKFKSTNITSTWGWMKEVGLVPSGFGKMINRFS